MEHISEIVAALGVIITAWFVYNQKTKDKLTDFKLEKWKEESERKMGEKNGCLF